MIEVQEDIAHKYELEISQALLDMWGKSFSREETKERVKRACEITKEADRLLAPEQKLHIAQTIRFFIKQNRGQLIEEFGEDYIALLDEKLNQIIGSKGVIGLSFFELHRLTVEKIIERSESTSPIELNIAEFKSLILGIFKGAVTDKKIIEIQTELDALSDQLRGKEPFDITMTQILELLVNKLNLKGAALAYTSPLKEEVEFGDDNFPKGEITEEKIPKTSKVNEEDVYFAIKKAEEKLLEGESQYTFVDISVGDDKEIHCIFMVEIEGKKLGVLDFILSSRDQITSEFETLARQAESSIDTLVDIGLNNQVKRRLEEQINEISIRTKVPDLQNTFQKYLTLLNRLIGAEIMFTYNPRLPSTKLKDYIVDSSSVKPLEGGMQFKENTYGRDIFDNRKNLFKSDEEAMQLKMIGSLHVTGEKPLTEEQRELVDIVANLINQDSLTINEKMASSINGSGHLVSNYALEGNLEWRGTHPVVVKMVDVEGSTKFCEDLAKMPNGEGRYPRMINNLYKGMRIIETDPNAPSVFDKPEGDKVILLTGPPFTTDGKDVFGDEEHNVGKYIAVALHNAEKVKVIWEDILDEEERNYGPLPYKPKLCIGIEFSEAAEVGFFGKDEKDEVEHRHDYTVIAQVSNEAARIQDQARGGEILISRAAWEKLIEYLEENDLDPSIQKFINTGLPIDVIGKGVANPIEVVKVIKEEEATAMQEEQRRLFKEKIEEVSEKGLAFNRISELCDGDYTIKFESESKAPRTRLALQVDDMELEALLSKERLPEITYAVSIDTHRKLLEEEEKNGFSNRRILRIKHGRSVIVKYECIENVQVEKILELLRESEEQGRGILINSEDLPAGEYKIISHEDREGEHVYELKRMSASLRVIIPDDQIEGEAVDSGLLIYESRKFSCKTASPEWEGLV